MPDGTFMGFHVPNDIGKPFCIAVDSKGERIGNESGAYMEFGQRMYAAGAIPAGNIDEVDNERWRHAWDLKVFGYINLSREVYAGMRGRVQNQRTEFAQFPLQLPRRGILGLALEGIAAHQFAKIGGLVCRSLFGGAHFVQDASQSGSSNLPRGFGAGETSADDVNGVDGSQTSFSHGSSGRQF